MENIITKTRDILGDNYKFIPDDDQEYITSKVFALQYANIDSTSLLVYKNGVLWSQTPVAGSGVSWSRTGTTITITKTAHGLITGDSITVTVSSDATALPLKAYTITKLTDNTFTVVGLNAGATSGTCTYTVVVNYSYSVLTSKVTVTGNLTVGDTLLFTYNAYEKYSNTELQGYIRSALYYLTIEQYKTFTIKNNIVFPTPSEAEESLVAIVASILIKGSIRSYRTPEISIVFGENLSVEDKIKKVVNQYAKAFGSIEYINTSEGEYPQDE